MELSAINHAFETEKNRKAFLYTCGVIGLFLIIAIFYTWPLQLPPVPTVQDLIEINLGNEQEGMGTVQPMVKGESAPDNQSVASTHEKATKIIDPPARTVQADENNDDKDAAPVVKQDKPKDDAKDINKVTPEKPTRNIHPSAVMNPNPTPPKPKNLYKGGNGNGGNGAAEDNGYRNQGYKPGNGDAGSPNGNADSYGDNTGGRISGGFRVVSGDRRIVRSYSFTDDLERATVYATIKVSPIGQGTFEGFAKNSSTTNPKYAESISNHLRQILFNKSDHESTIIVEFKFNVH